MKTWDDWSDFEVNKAVANIVREPWINMSKKEESESALHIIDCNGGYGMRKHSYVDYCNSSSDMWPIMISEEIIVGPSSEYKKHMAIGAAVIDEDCNICSDNIIYYHTNPLRAVAIVFLEMNGVRP